MTSRYLEEIMKMNEAEFRSGIMANGDRLMQNFDYIALALRTESAHWPFPNVGENLNRLLHASMGLCTEAGEFQDALKKRLFYGKPLDETNLKEEIGDILWYLAIACDALGTDFDTEMRRNIAKLQKRYPDKFTEEAAENRDLDGERKVLEGRNNSDSDGDDGA